MHTWVTMHRYLRHLFCLLSTRIGLRALTQQAHYNKTKLVANLVTKVLLGYPDNQVLRLLTKLVIELGYRFL